MAPCEVCGNEYDKSSRSLAPARGHIFDSFEMCIQAMVRFASIAKCRVMATGRGWAVNLCVPMARALDDSE